jgi:hypothetical protein
MVKIELTDGMLWRVLNQMPITDSSVGKLTLFKKYLDREWTASISYDDKHPVTGRRFLEFEDSWRAMEFVLKYG